MGGKFPLEQTVKEWDLPMVGMDCMNGSQEKTDIQGLWKKTLKKIIFMNMFYYSQPVSRLPEPGCVIQLPKTGL